MIEYTVKVCNDGSRFWHLNGKLHREDGPAIEGPVRAREWFLNGVRHRTDGPAIEQSNGGRYWFLNGEQVTDEATQRTDRCRNRAIAWSQSQDC